jgi:phosphoribosyl-ATP pyrophosphohydrolase/phosphoribosyl-AMP cyclohydrolase
MGPVEVRAHDKGHERSGTRASPTIPARRFFFAMTTIDFSKFHGLVPAVVQDAATRDVLMVGFMNQEAWDRTRRTGFVTFFSRTRNSLWTKGETSGNRLRVSKLWIDCDDDTILVEATCLGDGVVCHTGARTCFRELTAGSQAPEDGRS